MQDRNPKGKTDPASPLLLSIPPYTLSEAHPAVTQTFSHTWGYKHHLSAKGISCTTSSTHEPSPQFGFFGLFFFDKSHIAKKIQKHNLSN